MVWLVGALVAIMPHRDNQHDCAEVARTSSSVLPRRGRRRQPSGIANLVVLYSLVLVAGWQGSKEVSDWNWTGSNPIARAAIGIEFTSLFTPSVITKASSLHPTLKKMLPRRTNQQAMMLQMGPAGTPVAMPMPMPMPLLQPSQSIGFVFDRTDDAGQQAEAFNMSGNSAAYSCASYSRWNDVWSRASQIFGKMVPIITASGNLASAITLEYVNQFYWPGEIESADISSLLLEGPFVCPNVFRLSSLWHSFHGFFRDGIDPIPGRHIDNINLTLVDRMTSDGEIEKNRRCLDVVISHRFVFSTATSFVPGNRENGKPTGLDECTTSMHERNKGILRDLLKDPIITRIPGLGVSR